MKLLTEGNTKTIKGEKKGYKTFILHLAPHKLSGYNVCPMASKGCSAACLNTAGRGRFQNIQDARIRKTKWFFEDRDNFMRQLVKDIEAGIRQAEREKLIPVFRLNGTSDIRWENIPIPVGIGAKSDTPLENLHPNIMTMFPDIQFYDYTKLPNRKDLPKNYHLTFSRSESNDKHIATAIDNGMNVAVVFNTKKGADLPKTWRNLPVIDADETDLRFLDKKKSISGLRAKGSAKKDDSNFVVKV